jgi:hypothetical protein
MRHLRARTESDALGAGQGDPPESADASDPSRWPGIDLNSIIGTAPIPLATGPATPARSAPILLPFARPQFLGFPIDRVAGSP